MIREMLDKHFPICSIGLIVLLTAADYFLFKGYEYVFPFFFMPYFVMLIIYFAFYYRKGETGAFELAVYGLIIMPVFAGLIMDLAWMLKINFWGELLGGYLIR